MSEELNSEHGDNDINQVSEYKIVKARIHDANEKENQQQVKSKKPGSTSQVAVITDPGDMI